MIGAPSEGAFGPGPSSEATSANDELAIRGHKVYIFNRPGSDAVWIEMVNDDRPVVRMAIEMDPDEARATAECLLISADRADR